MSNALLHNKWHGFNHYTLPVPGFPDSGTDPIASLEHPFRGTFYNSIVGDFGSIVESITITDPGSGYSRPPNITLNALPGGNIFFQPVFNIGINNETKQVSSIDVVQGGRYITPVNVIITPNIVDSGLIKRTLKIALSSNDFRLNSNSYGWWYYSSLTSTFSAEWELYPSVLTTNIEYSSFWNEGYLGYLNQYNLSGKWESTFMQTSGLSGEEKYDFSGGTGWHIALSSITHRLNVPDQINIAQKVAVPVRIYENEDLTVYWKTSAQTVYYNLTGNFPLTATEVFDARKGGKYNMWLYIDACPEEKMNFIFDSEKYNIVLKEWDGLNDVWTDTLSNVLLLSANSITRIDFVYDGYKMLGRATRYSIFLDQTDDLYFMGTGLRFVDPLRINKIKNPVYISNQDPIYGNSFLNIPIEDQTNSTGIFIDDYYENYPERPEGLRSNFDANSSIYIAGSGIFMRYLNANNNYFSFNAYGASFQSEATLAKFRSLTASFDRVTLTLSGGDWRDPVYAENLAVTPDASILSPTMSAALPQPPYEITSSNIRTIAKCTSSFTVEINSGKDRDIRSVAINRISSRIIPNNIDGMNQPYNFNNERTCLLTFTRVQQDFTIDVYFTRQVPITIPQNLLSFNSMNGFTLKSNGSSLLNVWENGVATSNIELEQSNSANAPEIFTDKALRGIKFGGNKFMTSNLGLTALSTNEFNFFKSFGTFTVFKTNSFPISSVIWWLGDFTGTTEQRGYGLVLSASSNNSLTARLFTVSDYGSLGRIRNSIKDVTTIEANKTYVICTNFNTDRGIRRQEVYVNNRFSVYQRNLGVGPRFTDPLTNFNLTIGKNPNSNDGYSNVILYDLYLFNKALSREEIITMNRFLIEKIEGYIEV